MGDVLISLPVIRGVLEYNPDIRIILVTNSRFAGYFKGIDRLTIHTFYPDSTHSGFTGLMRLFAELRPHRPSGVLDLHGSLRSRFITLLFGLAGIPIKTVRKHRDLRRRVLSHKNAGISVPSAADRYLAVFRLAGLDSTPLKSGFGLGYADHSGKSIHSGVINIGFAPLARHSAKNWGAENAAVLIQLLVDELPAWVHLFGGTADHEILDSLVTGSAVNHAGRLSSEEEISVIRSLDAFISMDSANMHLAAAAGIPVVSIWGATDPSLGFAPLFQPADRSITPAESRELYCRPCSVYGQKSCSRTDNPMLCMQLINPRTVFEKIREIVGQPR